MNRAGRLSVLVVCLVALACRRAAAGEPAKADRPPAQKALSLEQVAEAVIAAAKSRDAEAMKKLASLNEPDPWIVADELLALGEPAAAEAFAKAGPRPDLERLPEYVASRAGKTDDVASRDGLRRAEVALAGRKLAEALDALGPSTETDPSDVVAIRRSFGRGLALDWLKRPDEARAALRAARSGAQKIGWLSRASRTLHELGAISYRGGDAEGAASLWRERVALDSRRGDRVSQAKTLLNLGLVLSSVGRHEDAMASYEKALEIQRVDRDRSGEALSLGFLGALQQRREKRLEAIAIYEQALAIHRETKNVEREAEVLGNLGTVYQQLGRFDEALESHGKALTLLDGLGDRQGVGERLRNMGEILRTMGRNREALEHHLRGREVLREHGDPASVAWNEVGLAMVYVALSDVPRGQEALEEAIRRFEGAGLLGNVGDALNNMGAAFYLRGEYRRALALLERARKVREGLEDRPGTTRTDANIASVHLALGDPALALEILARVLRSWEEIGNRTEVAAAHGSIGSAHRALGNYSLSLSHAERSLAVYEAMGDRAAVAGMQSELGQLYAAMGQSTKALEQFEKALAFYQRTGHRSGIAVTLGNVGLMQTKLGNHAVAIESLRRAVALNREAANEAQAIHALGNLAHAHEMAGKFAEAAKLYEEVVSAKRARGEMRSAVEFLVGLGIIRMRLGELDAALPCFTEALEVARDAGDRPAVARALRGIARYHLVRGAPADSIGPAKEAVDILATLGAGLAEGEGGSVRGQVASVFDVGAQAALRMGEADTAAHFLESGRAGTLLEALGGRERLRARVLPDDLRREEAEARAKEVTALERRRVLSVGADAAAARQALADWESAREGLRDVIARIQRDAKAAAGVVYPMPDDLSTIRASLRDGEVLVEFALPTVGEALALVVTATGARVVALDESKEIERLCGAALRAETPFRTDPALWAALRERVVTPLALGAESRRVLFSPDGVLSFVPPALLFPEREVVAVPSGTTYRVLSKERGARGSSILALGDPDYGTRPDPSALLALRGGEKLVPLPATREEARAVGDVVLLGADATEAGLRAAVAKRPRWRAVHLACHGLVDPERPWRTSLALTPANEDDGFLTALDVFGLRVPADLVVLSACETGKGALVRGEGIIGLTRAFMYAGAPRVLVSVWKVDDEPTRVLMTKFYSLWNPKDGSPGLPAARALREAQAFVASHEKWRHPFFWAPWVLWGLGD